MTTGRHAEKTVRDILELWGLENVRLTRAGADGGIDIVATGIVVQVKDHFVPVSRPDLQRLVGVARVTNAQPLFFSTSGYTIQAREWAGIGALALFHLEGIRALPVNAEAERFVRSTVETAEQRAQRQAAEGAEIELEQQRAEQSRRDAAQAKEMAERAASDARERVRTWSSVSSNPVLPPTSSEVLEAGPAKCLTWFGSIDVGVDTKRLVWTGAQIVAVGDEGPYSRDTNRRAAAASPDLSQVTWREPLGMVVNPFKAVTGGCGKIFLASGNELGGYQVISAFDGAALEPVWEKEFPGKWLGLLAVEDAQIIGEMGPGAVSTGNGIAAWSIDDGELIWCTPPDEGLWYVSRPALVGTTLVFVTARFHQDPSLLALDARDGTVKWERTIRPLANHSKSVDVMAPLIIDHDKVLVPVPAEYSDLRWELWDMEGSRIWRAPSLTPGDSPIANVGRVIVTSRRVDSARDTAPEFLGYDRPTRAAMVLSISDGSELEANLNSVLWIAQGASTAWASDGRIVKAWFADGSLSPSILLPDLGQPQAALVMEDEVAVLYLAVKSMIHGFLIEDGETNS